MTSWKISIFYPHNGETIEKLAHSRNYANVLADYYRGLTFPHWPPTITITATNQQLDAEASPL